MEKTYLELPPIDILQIRHNAEEYKRKHGAFKSKNWDGQIGSNERKVVVLIADVYSVHLKEIKKARELQDQDFEGVRISLGFLRKSLQCSKKSIKKWLLHLEVTGAIKIENDGKEGVKVWPTLFPMFSDPQSFEHYLAQIENTPQP